MSDAQRIAVLKGGRSLERTVSMRSGAQVQEGLQRLGHEVLAIDVGPGLIPRLRADRPPVHRLGPRGVHPRHRQGACQAPDG
jgi:D-alanine-D-alanine ligase